jgi:hypothetical protein
MNNWVKYSIIFHLINEHFSFFKNKEEIYNTKNFAVVDFSMIHSSIKNFKVVFINSIRFKYPIIWGKTEIVIVSNLMNEINFTCFEDGLTNSRNLGKMNFRPLIFKSGFNCWTNKTEWNFICWFVDLMICWVIFANLQHNIEFIFSHFTSELDVWVCWNLLISNRRWVKFKRFVVRYQ